MRLLLEQEIISFVSEYGPVKATELATRFALDNLHYLTSEEFTTKFSDSIDRLVKQGELIEVEYCLPNMDYRVKSMLFPKGTKINVHGEVCS